MNSSSATNLCSYLSIFLILLPGFQSAKSQDNGPVTDVNGMVVSSNQIASEIGREVLKGGGNAVDAAVAVGFALAVVHPTAGNIGGGGFMIIRTAEDRIYALDYREKAPLRAHRNMYLDVRGNFIPSLSTEGYLASGVPGTVAGLALANRKFGTKSLRELIGPAIELAEKGFPVSERLHRSIKRYLKSLKKYPSTAAIFLKNGRPYLPGEILVQKDLARTLKLIAEEGERAFYRGKISDLIVNTMRENGGLITKEDLLRYRAVVRKPVTGKYRGYEIISMPPPSSGGVALIQMLNVLEHVDLGRFERYSHNAIFYL
ncbi:MAG: gamma-glutamyltransferase family protein, partial [Fidelibacterota bacterium]